MIANFEMIESENARLVDAFEVPGFGSLMCASESTRPSGTQQCPFRLLPSHVVTVFVLPSLQEHARELDDQVESMVTPQVHAELQRRVDDTSHRLRSVSEAKDRFAEEKDSAVEVTV